MYFINFLFFLYTKLFRKNYDHFISHKYETIKKYYGQNCLDIGAGYGHFSAFLHENGHNVTAIDVTNKFQHKLNFIQFDGKSIPLKDNEVDTSIIMFVLHHTDNQMELLEETCRVTQGYIIIGEDIMKSAVDKVFGNIHLNTSPWAKSNNLFHSTDKWMKIFLELKLELVQTVIIPRNTYPVYPVNRSIFVLKKST